MYFYTDLRKKLNHQNKFNPPKKKLNQQPNKIAHSIMFVLVVLLSLFQVWSQVHGATYCLCTQQFVYDPTNECGSSGSYNLQNACFRCPVVNSSGTFYYCGSLPFLGYGACNQAGALAASQTACTAIGGNTGLTSFVCSTSTGTNYSQSSGCNTGVPGPAPTLSAPVVSVPTSSSPSSTSSPSNAPVSGGPPVSTTTVAPTSSDSPERQPSAFVTAMVLLTLPFLLAVMG